MNNNNTIRPHPKIPYSRILKKPELIASLLLIVALFLPWFSNPGLTVPGIKIPKILGFFSIPQPVSEFLVLLTFLIPIGGIIIFVLTILNKPVALFCMITGIIPIIIGANKQFFCLTLYYHDQRYAPNQKH